MEEEFVMKPNMKSKREFKGLDKDKKQLLKKSMGSVKSPIDFNKVRDEWKYGNN
jgi:hypothetical protein